MMHVDHVLGIRSHLSLTIAVAEGQKTPRAKWMTVNRMRGSRKFCQRGPTLTTFFYYLGEEGSKYHLNDNGPTLNAGLVALKF